MFWLIFQAKEIAIFTGMTLPHNDYLYAHGKFSTAHVSYAAQDTTAAQFGLAQHIHVAGLVDLLNLNHRL